MPLNPQDFALVRQHLQNRTHILENPCPSCQLMVGWTVETVTGALVFQPAEPPWPPDLGPNTLPLVAVICNHCFFTYQFSWSLIQAANNG